MKQSMQRRIEWYCQLILMPSVYSKDTCIHIALIIWIILFIILFLSSNNFQNIPPDLSQCVFVIEQALSVRALQELVTAAGSETVIWNFFEISWKFDMFKVRIQDEQYMHIRIYVIKITLFELHCIIHNRWVTTFFIWFEIRKKNLKLRVTLINS